MFRHHATNLLLQLLGWLCTDHVPLIGTTPLLCAVCFRPVNGRHGPEEDE